MLSQAAAALNPMSDGVPEPLQLRIIMVSTRCKGRWTQSAVAVLIRQSPAGITVVNDTQQFEVDIFTGWS